MDLGAFAAAPAVIQLHAICATGALVLGAVQLAGPKGTLPPEQARATRAEPANKLIMWQH